MTGGERNSDAAAGVANAASLRELAERVKMGNRVAAAEVVTRYGPLLRQRIRSKLGKGVRALFDSEDILATVARRLDAALVMGTVRINDAEHLLALVQRMMRSAVVDKARIVKRLRAADGHDAEWSSRLLTQMCVTSPDLDADGLDRLTSRLEHRDDRLQLWLWLRGESHETIAHELGITPAAARKRWERLRARMCTILSET